MKHLINSSSPWLYIYKLGLIIPRLVRRLKEETLPGPCKSGTMTVLKDELIQPPIDPPRTHVNIEKLLRFSQLVGKCDFSVAELIGVE